MKTVALTAGVLSKLHLKDVVITRSQRSASYLSSLNRNVANQSAGAATSVLTNKRLITAIEIILETGINKIYVATLPEINAHKIDVDSLIKEKGVEIFKETLAEALPYYEYKLQITLHKYGKIEEKQGHLTKKDEDNLLDEVVEISTQLQPIDKDRFIKFFVSGPTTPSILFAPKR